MKLLVSLLAAFSISAFAQKPPSPPPDDMPKQKSSPEGTKEVEPDQGAVKPHDSRHKKVKPKRPPVKPPVPEPTAPDQPQDGIQ